MRFADSNAMGAVANSMDAIEGMLPVLWFLLAAIVVLLALIYWQLCGILDVMRKRERPPNG